MSKNLIFLLLAILLAGCQASVHDPSRLDSNEFTAFLQASKPEEIGTPTVATIEHPGRVVVPVEETLERLRDKDINVERRCSEFIPHSSSVFSEVYSPRNYGLDERYYAVQKAFKSLGEACFVGDLEACKKTQSYAMRWATESGVIRPRGGGYDAVFYNDTLTINMRLVVPMLSALGVAEARSPMTKAHREIFDSWIERIVSANEHMMRREGNYDPPIFVRKAAGNHAIQSANAHMALGAWLGDPDFFEKGLEQWSITLSSMRADGSLPVETRRGSRALFYTGRTIAALTYTAEMATSQGIDLWSWAPSENQTIHLAVRYMIDAMVNPDLVLPYARVNKAPGPSEDWRRQDVVSESIYAWVAPYMARFPNHPNTIRLQNRISDERESPHSLTTYNLDKAVMRGGTAKGDWNMVNGRCFFGESRIGTP
jgi:hypothetical protein